MRTRTAFTPWNQVEDRIRAKERDGWGVRLIVPAKRPKLSSTTGVEDGFLVVFEKEPGEELSPVQREQVDRVADQMGGPR